MTTVYLTVAEVLAIHEDQIERYGGSPGVRDLGQLEAALFRPQTGYYADRIAEAAALWESLSQNHAFVDGNKRTAFAVTFTFLSINGITLTADEDQIIRFLIPLYDRSSVQFDKLDAQERRGRVALDGREGGEAHEAAGADQERLGGEPAGAVGLCDREDDRPEARGREQGPAKIEPGPARRVGVGRDDRDRGDREGRRDGEVGGRRGGGGWRRRSPASRRTR